MTSSSKDRKEGSVRNIVSNGKNLQHKEVKQKLRCCLSNGWLVYTMEVGDEKTFRIHVYDVVKEKLISAFDEKCDVGQHESRFFFKALDQGRFVYNIGPILKIFDPSSMAPSIIVNDLAPSCHLTVDNSANYVIAYEPSVSRTRFRKIDLKSKITTYLSSNGDVTSHFSFLKYLNFSKNEIITVSGFSAKYKGTMIQTWKSTGAWKTVYSLPFTSEDHIDNDDKYLVLSSRDGGSYQIFILKFRENKSFILKVNAGILSILLLSHNILAYSTADYLAFYDLIHQETVFSISKKVNAMFYSNTGDLYCETQSGIDVIYQPLKKIFEEQANQIYANSPLSQVASEIVAEYLLGDRFRFMGSKQSHESLDDQKSDEPLSPTSNIEENIIRKNATLI